ncbi:MAG: hypothetical protein GY708_17875 [Actinomycetia bacterium]|nr:hypothetical protein [Actinomycetes bacterium]
MLPGAYDAGELRFVDSVGTGFGANTLEWISSALTELGRATDRAALAPGAPPSAVRVLEGPTCCRR